MEIEKKLRLVTEFIDAECIEIVKGAIDDYAEHPLKKIKIPQDLRLVNKYYSSELYPFLKFDKKSQYNVYGNCTSDNKEWEYLIGVLDVEKDLGCFELKDKTSKIPVKFIPSSGDLYQFKEALVLIKKWKIFTEIFEIEMSKTLKLLLLNIEDVRIIKSLNNEKCYYLKDEGCNIGGKFIVYMEVLRKTEVIMGYGGIPEVWVEAAYSETLPITQRTGVYAILPSDMHPFIKEKMVYKLISDEKGNYVPIDSIPELFGLREIKLVVRLSRATIFQETDITPYFDRNKIIFSNVEDVKSIRDDKQEFSFILTISKKQLQISTFPPFIPKRHNMAHFGNLEKEHQMRFMFTDSEKNILDLYLNNRDNHITPSGLIPGIVVQVNYVKKDKKGKYARCQLFTTFQIIDYCPKLEYCSANLSYKTPGSWRWNVTQSTPFELFFDLPENCIVHSSFIFLTIYDLYITPICYRCKKIIVAGVSCISCKTSERDLNLMITVRAQGPMSSIERISFNIDADKEFFLSLLGLKKTEEERYFCNAFFKCRGLRVDFCKLSNLDLDSITDDARSKDFLRRLVDTLQNDINYKLYSLVDAVCLRKFEKTPWLMLDFEMVEKQF